MTRHHSSDSALYLVSQRQDISSKSCTQPAFLSSAPLFFHNSPRTFVSGNTKGVGFMPCSHSLSCEPAPIPDQQELVIFLNPEETDRTTLTSQPALEEMNPDKLSDTVTQATDKETRLKETNRKWVESKIRPHLLCFPVHSSHLSL